jgi:hypothetical protein
MHSRAGGPRSPSPTCGPAEPARQQGSQDALPFGLAATLWCLRLDLVAAEVVAELEGAGVPCILLKGPAVARWIYPDGGRVYGDVDLLVEPCARRRAESVLTRLGFVDAYPGESPLERSDRSRAWVRGDDTVDLHVSIEGTHKPAERAWFALLENTEPLTVGGRELTVLNPAGRALHIALHACQHGQHEAQPLQDLDRALDVLPEQVWGDAYVLAERLRAVDAFGAGLRLAPAGHDLADTLGVPNAARPGVVLRSQGGGHAPGMNIDRVVRAPGLRAKVATGLRWTFPSPAKMRRLFPLARRGRSGLALAYARRLTRVGAAVVEYGEWRAARRQQSKGTCR